jgi:FtsH-binding integral membrane protein
MGMTGFGFGSSSIPETSVQTFNPIMRMVYLWMTLGLAVTGVIAWVLAGTEVGLQIATNPALLIGAVILQFVLVIGLTAGLMRLAPGVAIAMFFLYAAVTGVMFSMIFLAYDLGTIQLAFFSTAGAFLAMSVVGYTTQLDLSQYRTYFIMGLIGLIVAGFVNILFKSPILDMAISMVGVVIFVALTAYDTQKIKRMAADPAINSDGSMSMRVSIYGALSLYLDFINLFLYLLRLFGRSRR